MRQGTAIIKWENREALDVEITAFKVLQCCKVWSCLADQTLRQNLPISGLQYQLTAKRRDWEEVV